MEKIKAKSIINNEYWILQKDNTKIGQITVRPDSKIEVRIHGNHAGQFESVDDLKKSDIFEFTELPNPRAQSNNTVHGFPAEGQVFNAVWDVQHGLPLYTQDEDSKSWFAAGYYKISISGNWVVKFCPKLITLQRNPYDGPFKVDPSLTQFNKIFE